MSAIIQFLAKKSDLTPLELKNIIDTASHRYKTYAIPKKQGGYRTIHHPAKEIKFLQELLVRNLFNKMPIHPAVNSYQKNISIKTGALKHVRNKYLLKIDFENFFESIKSTDVENCLKRKFASIDNSDLEIISKIVCLNRKLTIGAPSSPIISNFIMFELDQAIQSKCTEMEITYTRYADDLSFSTNQQDVLKYFFDDLKLIIENNEMPKLKINHSKSVFTSKKRRRKITGLILTSGNKISVGRLVKKEIKSLVHQFKLEILPPEKRMYLKGKLSYIKDVEPSFILALRQKYTNETINNILN